MQIHKKGKTNLSHLNILLTIEAGTIGKLQNRKVITVFRNKQVLQELCNFT